MPNKKQKPPEPLYTVGTGWTVVEFCQRLQDVMRGPQCTMLGLVIGEWALEAARCSAAGRPVTVPLDVGKNMARLAAWKGVRWRWLFTGEGERGETGRGVNAADEYAACLGVGR